MAEGITTTEAKSARRRVAKLRGRFAAALARYRTKRLNAEDRLLDIERKFFAAVDKILKELEAAER